MKTINVVAAIIQKDNKILIARRLKGNQAGKWEFPGGKIEPNETPRQALIREIKEELEADIQVNDYVCTIEHQYPDFFLNMQCYSCTLLQDYIHLNDHSEIRWIDKDEEGIEWCEADEKAINSVMR